MKKLLGSPPVLEEPDEETPQEKNSRQYSATWAVKIAPSLKLNMCNRALMENNKPKPWSPMNIVTVIDNYREISLIRMIAKMYNRMILNKSDVLNLKLRPNQNGFRKKRTSRSNPGPI